MKNKYKEGHCYGTPDQIAELMKQGLTNKLAVDTIFIKADRQNTGGKFVPCVAPYLLDKTQCTFLENNKCTLKIKLSHCRGHGINEKKNLGKQWLKVKGQAVLKLFFELMKVDESENTTHVGRRDGNL